MIRRVPGIRPPILSPKLQQSVKKAVAGVTMQGTHVFEKLNNAYEARKTVAVLEGGSRSSKTHSICQFLIKYAQDNKNTTKRVLIARQKGTWTSATVMHDFFEILKFYNLYNPKNHNRTNKIYKLHKTEFWFGGLDDAQKLHGFQSDIFWINEAVEAGSDDFDQLEQRLKEGGFAILDYNPSHEEHWIYDRVCKRPDAEYIHSTMLDNPFISTTARRKILSYEPTPENIMNGTADRRKWDIYGLGKRAKLEGQIFDNWDIIDEWPGWLKHERLGLDWGYTNDVTAGVRVGWSGNDIYVDELIYQTGLLNSDIGKKLKGFDLGNIKIWADSSEAKSIDELYKMGLNIHGAKKPPGSVIQGIDILKRYRIHFTKRSINAITEAKRYTYIQDKNGIYLNEPVDEYNHAWDAIRYVAFMELGQKRSERNTTGDKAKKLNGVM